MAKPSAELKLINPTPKQLEHQNSLNSTAFRGALSLEAYLRREVYLARQGLADGGLKAWALVSSDAKSEEQEVFAGCETLRKRALVSRDGQVEEVTAYGIASVFTPPKHRGNKYASIMVQKLAEMLPSFEKGSLFSILYSDIGKDFYARQGWKVFPSSHVSLTPEYAPNLLDTLDAIIKPLYDADLPALCEEDESIIWSRLARADKSSVVAAQAPDYATITWHHAREDFVAEELLKRKPTIRGAMARVGGRRLWAIFNRMWYNADPKQTNENTLHILRLVVEDEEGVNDESSSRVSGDVVAGLSAILRVAQHEASEWNMETVELWNPSQTSLEAVRRIDPAAVLVDRDQESIASLAWYGDPATADRVIWRDNEKYGWC